LRRRICGVVASPPEGINAFSESLSEDLFFFLPDPKEVNHPKSDMRLSCPSIDRLSGRLSLYYPKPRTQPDITKKPRRLTDVTGFFLVIFKNDAVEDRPGHRIFAS
jgi:hypothetical protein